MNMLLKEDEEVEMISILKNMIKLPSSLQDGGEIYDHVYNELKKIGIDVQFQELENPYSTYQHRSNIYAKIGNGMGPKIMLNGHLDTVSPSHNWYFDPYDPREEDGKIFGVGSADMKGGCASIIGCVRRLLKEKKELNGTLFITFVFGEEAPFSLGADTLLRQFDMKDYDLIIIPEPSPLLSVNDYCYTHKKYHRSRFPVPIIGAEGRVLFEIDLLGRSAHASHPSQGINALEDASRLITRLSDFDLFSSVKMGRGHYCVLNIEGGDKTFTVPSFCKIFVNRQLTLGEDEASVTKELKGIVKKMKLNSKVQIKKRFSPDPLLEYRPYLSDTNDYTEKFMKQLPKPKRGKKCRFTTSSVGDFNVFATRTGVPTIAFGPGGGNIHSPNEYVNRQEVIDTANYLLNFLLEVF